MTETAEIEELRSKSEIEEASIRWPRTGSGRKVACPDCGKTGYPKGSWTHCHRFHDRCPDCGKTVTSKGMGVHRSACWLARTQT